MPKQLYVRDPSRVEKVYGPFLGSQLRRLVERGELLPTYQVSLDKRKWVPATKVKPPLFSESSANIVNDDGKRSSHEAPSGDRAKPPRAKESTHHGRQEGPTGKAKAEDPSVSIASADWYYLPGTNEQPVGPVSLQDLRSFTKEGRINEATAVAQGTDSAWIAAKQIEFLFARTENAPSQATLITPVRKKLVCEDCGVALSVQNRGAQSVCRHCMRVLEKTFFKTFPTHTERQRIYAEKARTRDLAAECEDCGKQLNQQTRFLWSNICKMCHTKLGLLWLPDRVPPKAKREQRYALERRSQVRLDSARGWTALIKGLLTARAGLFIEFAGLSGIALSVPLQFMFGLRPPMEFLGIIVGIGAILGMIGQFMCIAVPQKSGLKPIVVAIIGCIIVSVVLTTVSILQSHNLEIAAGSQLQTISHVIHSIRYLLFLFFLRMIGRTVASQKLVRHVDICFRMMGGMMLTAVLGFAIWLLNPDLFVVAAMVSGVFVYGLFAGTLGSYLKAVTLGIENIRLALPIGDLGQQADLQDAPPAPADALFESPTDMPVNTPDGET